MKAPFFYLFISSFVRSSTWNISIAAQKIIQLSTTLVLVCQSLRLSWSPVFSPQNSSNFSIIWKILSLSSLENILAFLPNSGISMLILAFLPLCILTLAFSQFLLMISFNKNWKILWLALGRLIRLQETFLFIPVSLTLLIIFKYSTTNSSEITIGELSGELGSESFNYGAEGMIFSSVSLVVLITVVAANEGFNYEISHFKSDEHLDSKFFCESELIKKILVFLRCWLYVQISKDYYEIFLVVSLLTYVLQTGIYLTYLAYYNEYMNKLRVFESFEGILFCGGFLMGNILDNESIVLMLVIIMQPYVAFISSYICDHQAKKFRIELNENISKVHFEHFFREKLKNKERISDFFVSTQNILEKSENALVHIIEALYCKVVLNNSMLGLNKLNEYKWISTNIFTNFHIYQTYLVLEQSIEPSNGIKTVIFLEKLEKIIKEEENYFLEIEKLSYELHKSNPSLMRLKKAIRKVTKKKLSVKDQYESFLKIYPNSIIGFEMYGTFLIEILNDSFNGKPLVEKAALQRSFKMIKNEKNIFSDVTANLMLVSGDLQTLGKVLYVSRPLCKTLKIKYSESKQYSLNDFIPKPYKARHSNYLKNFFKYSETNKFLPEYAFIMMTNEEYLVECDIRAENITKMGKSSFVIHVNEVKIKREVAIVSVSGDIYATSKGFGIVIGHENRNYSGQNLHDLLETELVDGLKFLKTIDRETGFLINIEIVIETKRVISTDMIFVYCSKNEKQHKRTVTFVNKRKNKLIFSEIDEKVEKSQESESMNMPPKEINSNVGETSGTKSTLMTSDDSKKKIIFFNRTERMFDAITILLYLIITLIIIIALIVVIYILDQVNHSTSLDSINIFGNYKYMACYFSLMTKATQLTDILQSVPLFDLQELYSLKQNIKIYKKELLNRYTEWSYCPVTNEFIANNFIVYNINSTRKTNFINEVLVFDSTADRFYNKVQNGEKDYDEEAFYIIIDYFRMSYINFDKLHDEITACEETKVVLLQTQVNNILISAAVIIVVLYLVVFVLVMALSRKLSEIWRIFYKSAKHGIPVLGSQLMKRIKRIHRSLPKKSKSVFNLANPASYEKFHHKCFYILRFSIFLFIICVCYFVSASIFIENLSQLLIKRADLNNIELDRRSYIAQLSFFMLESIEKNYLGVDLYQKDINPYKDPEQEYLNVINNLQSTEIQYFISDLGHFYSSSEWSMLFESIPNEQNFLGFGILPSFSFIIQESLYLNSTNVSYSNLVNYFENLKNLISLFNITKTDQVNTANLVIDQSIQSLIWFLMVWHAILIILVVFWYIPLISEEKEIIRCLEKTIENFPSVKVFKQSF